MRQQLAYFRIDLRKYSWRERFTEPVMAAHLVYRLGRGTLSLPSPLRQIASVIYGFAHIWAKIISSGVDIPRNCDIGPGLRLYHCGPILVSHRSTFGSDLSLGHGVTIGPLTEETAAPIVGDRCVFSSYAQVFGDLTIGDDVKVGAMSVVLKSLPDGVVAAGVPARILKPKPAED